MVVTEFGDIAQWDLTMQQVIPFIDGVNFVGKIAKLTGVSNFSNEIMRCLSFTEEDKFGTHSTMYTPFGF